MNNILTHSAGQMASAIRARSISSEELVRLHLQQIERVNPALGAIVCLDGERALGQARAADAALARGDAAGPLHGVPMTIKDSLDTAGLVSSGGTEGRRQFVPPRDATVVARLRSAGAILLGKTNTPELTLAFETDNLLYGRTNNPYDVQRSSGGSSGGAAAIIAACGSPFDIGSDTGGSIRLPAHFCGIAGIRPTSGRVPRTGHILPPGGMLDALTTLGPMARSVADLALILPLICGPDWRDPAVVPMPLGDPAQVDVRGLRVGLFTDNGILTPTPAILAVVRGAAQALAEAGCLVDDVQPPGVERTGDLFARLFQADAGASTYALLARYGTTRPHPWLVPAPETALSAREVSLLLQEWDAFRSDMLAFMQHFDALICPTHSSPAIPHGSSDDPGVREGFTYTKTFNLTGWPAAVVRCGTSPERLPIGVQVVAPPWREEVALAVAGQLEQALGGWQAPDDEALAYRA